MRHFDAWLLRDPYSIFHYYPTNRRWSETIRALIQDHQICAPTPSASASTPSTPDAFQEIHPQRNSPLFTRLPPEIRSIIWSYVFGEPVLHLVQIRNQIRHVRCPNPVSAIDKNRRCCPVTAARWRTDVDIPSAASPASPSNSSSSTNKQPPNTDPNSKLYAHTHPSLPAHLSTTPASLLRTCRAIYNEAAPHLYRDATFDVDDLSTWIAFTDQVNPACLGEVRTLSVQVVPLGGIPAHSIHTHTHNPHLWTTFWHRTTTRCPHLTDLTLCIDLGRFTTTTTPTPTSNPGTTTVIGGYKLPLHAGIDAEWLRPIVRRVRGLQRFELAVTARCEAAARAGVEREDESDGDQDGSDYAYGFRAGKEGWQRRKRRLPICSA
ncbi:hypothetical protein BO86DRAFT_448061 [Aspergillus japonicus CBS 114.51]|uniref:DUF7730 domain-containing protein n=2 Tax=Aspergillus TaxID=5052 RepID=A0A2V5H3Y8_ASPV1|nr:hypothetical protein BO86DRAFT_448061 [Aspergillus japonicus CBS 114.51]PYI18738.1 hypothetical protein BO99DRAFT_482329 [Aspergillus violaceofuscus CBS 115571]RAH82078.1 hypothetical protein BO86DRAFT_448061 [Aspergillus japonicus CBS 114.51]